MCVGWVRGVARLGLRLAKKTADSGAGASCEASHEDEHCSGVKRGGRVGESVQADGRSVGQVDRAYVYGPCSIQFYDVMM